MNTLSILATSIVAGISTAAFALEPPPPPSMYGDGPVSLQVTATDLSVPERAGYALYESLMQTAEAAILAKNCDKMKGTYQLTTFADGATDSPSSNSLTVFSPGGVGSLTLSAKLKAPDKFRGQILTTEQVGAGSLNGVLVQKASGTSSFNAKGTMMMGWFNVNVKGINGLFDQFNGKVIKDFFRDTGLRPLTACAVETTCAPEDPYIYDWGLQGVAKMGYPVNKWWQRSKSIRDDGYTGTTVFVKDRLVGAGGSCRITLASEGSNNADLFWQDGYLTISTDKPSAPVTW